MKSTDEEGILLAFSCGQSRPLCYLFATKGTNWTASYRRQHPNSKHRILLYMALLLLFVGTCRWVCRLMFALLDWILIINRWPFWRIQNLIVSKHLFYWEKYLRRWLKCSRSSNRDDKYSYQKDMHILWPIAAKVILLDFI